MTSGTDVIVIGGGAVGLSTAWELAQAGASVRLIDRGRCGREASWAGAGMIMPGNSLKAVTPEARLRAVSYELWSSVSQKLVAETEIDNEFRKCGGLEVRFETNEATLAEEVDRWRSEGVDVEPLNQKDLSFVESSLSPELTSGYQLPGMAQIRNPRHLRALQTACVQRGVEIVEEAAVVGFDSAETRIRAVRTEGDVFQADQVCVCAGAWTSTLLSGCGFRFEIEPVRGQMVMLKCNPLPFSHIIQAGSRYLVPRSDGRALVGSTEERGVGFKKRTTAAGVGGLIRFAISLVPELADATVERTWSGLRPGSPAGVPYLGRVAAFTNLFAAAGHFRCGLQNSPATGRFMRELLLGQETCLDPADFGPSVQADAVAIG